MTSSWDGLSHLYEGVSPTASLTMAFIAAVVALGAGSAMADIFISYSKADHALALKLSIFLEAEG